MDRYAPLPRLEYSLDDLLHNCRQLRQRLPRGVGLMAVVKDRAYGCGSASAARVLERYGGVRHFAVNNPSEAFFLRRSGITSPILILGPALPSAIRKGVTANLLFTLNDLSDLDAWNATGVPVRFHCNVDTRMHRMGILPGEAREAARRIAALPLLRLEGVYTHLANADDPATPTVRKQLNTLHHAAAYLKKAGSRPFHVHYANSAGISNLSLNGCTLARPGIELYGCRPNPLQPVPLDLRPIITLKSSVIKIKRVPAGTPVSYGGTYRTRYETCIATIALGYGCGYPRSLGNRGDLLIGGKRCRIRGRITMDMCMVDAGPRPAFGIGDDVVAIGQQGDERITPDDIALLDHTIAYEVLCRLGIGLDRTWFFRGKVAARGKGYIY